MFFHRAETHPFAWNGLAIRDHTAGRGLSSSVAEIEVPAGASHPLAHSTRSDKYYAVVAGEIVFELDGGRSRLSAGDVAFVARGTRFSYRNETGAAARLLLVQTPSFDPAAEVLD